MTSRAEQALTEALAHHQARDLAAASHAYQRALDLAPGLPGARLGLAMVLLDSGLPETALALLEPLAQRHPGSALTRSLQGQALLLLERPEEAETHLRQALAADPTLTAGHVHLAQCLQLRGAHEQALASLEQALSSPAAAAPVHTARAASLQALGRYPEAEAALRTALAQAPDDLAARYNLAMLLLLLGRLEEGWAGRELRWAAAGVAPRRLPIPAWDGRALPGRSILLHGAQEGLGDAIMALRYAEPLKAQGARVLVECQPSLTELFRTCPWVDHVLGVGEPLPPCDCQALLMSLPGLFGTRLDSIPQPIPYLSAPALASPGAQLLERRMAVPGRLKIGLVHAGNPGHREDARRSIPPAELAVLARLGPGVTFFSLQQHRQPALPALPAELGAVDLGDLLEDFSATARAVAGLDLLISVDTSVAHLAGAMGKPVFLLLAQVPEWRWLLERRDSPWYPSFRLYRQPRAGDWSGALEQLLQEAQP